PIADASWRNTKFVFYNECCEKVEMTACDVLRAAQQLSYVYESEPPQVNQFCSRKIIPWVIPELIGAIKLKRPFVLDRKQRQLPLIQSKDRELADRLTSLGKKGQPDTVTLQFKGVEADRNPGAIWEVYVGLPQNAKPSAESAYFVGNVALF